MQKHSAKRLKHLQASLILKSGPALRARVFLLCLLTMLGTLAVASHEHEPIFGSQYFGSHSDSHSDEAPADVDLESLVAGDCDQFHINTLAAVDASPIRGLPFQGREKGLVASFSADSISPELFPPARAPPFEKSLT